MSHGSDEFEDSEAISVSGKIMFAAIIILFLAIVLVLFLHLYSKWVWARQATRSPTRRRLTFAPARDSVLAPRRGLDPSIIRSLPVIVFTPTQFKDGLECAVCLCELSDGDKARLLPKCNHGFHLDCIDMWFQSHSTCPLCRNPVALEFSAAPKSDDAEFGIPEVNLADGHSTDSPNFPTNVLFWGDENQVNARRSGALEEGTSSSPLAASTSSATKMERYGSLVIEIPRLVAESLSSPSSLPSPSIHFAEDESKSPMPTRLRSLRRLLSRETRVSPCSPNAGDIEQGEPAVSNA